MTEAYLSALRLSIGEGLIGTGADCAGQPHFGAETNVTLLFVHSDANMVYGWFRLCAALLTVLILALYATI
jgi:hypothetical protein